TSQCSTVRRAWTSGTSIRARRHTPPTMTGTHPYGLQPSSGRAGRSPRSCNRLTVSRVDELVVEHDPAVLDLDEVGADRDRLAAVGTEHVPHELRHTMVAGRRATGAEHVARPHPLVVGAPDADGDRVMAAVLVERIGEVGVLGPERLDLGAAG